MRSTAARGWKASAGTFLALTAVTLGLVPAKAASAAPSVVNVPADVGTIQGGIDLVADGGTVVVAAGVYREHLAFHGRKAEVRSADGPARTIIEGDRGHTTVVFYGAETPESVLRGFTIRNGGVGIQIANSSPTIVGNIISGNGSWDPNYSSTPSGAGISVQSSHSTIRDNVIRGNRGIWGGGVSVSGGDGVVIEGNTIEGNQAMGGGGIELSSFGTPLVINNLFRANHADSSGGGIEAGTARVVQNVFVDNATDGSGGGVAANGGTELVSNTFLDNQAQYGTAVSESGGFFATDNVITGPPTGAAVYCQGLPGRLFFNDVHNGTANPFKFCGDVTGIVGNISVDPRLRADFSPGTGSPVIDAGHEDPVAPRLAAADGNGGPRVTDGNADGTAVVDMGAFEWPGGGWTPEAAVAPGALDFGAVAVGAAASRTITLTGGGHRWTTHPGTPTITPPSPGLSVAAGECAGAILAPTESCSVTVTFAPTAVGALRSVVTIPSDAGTFTVPVTGRAADVPAEAYVDHVARELLGRPPTPAETAAWSPMVGDARGRVSLTVALVGTREHRAHRVNDDARTWLGHAADPGQAAALVNAMALGAIVEIGPALFGGSDEFYAHAGGTPEAYIDALFRATVGVAPDAAGRAALAGVLRTGYSRTSLAVLLLTHPAARARLVDAEYRRLLGHAPDAAMRTFWVDTITKGTRSEYLVAYLLSTEEYLARAIA